MENPEWNDPVTLPQINVGAMREFIIAVYRKHSGKVYTFAASYLNAYRLNYDRCPNEAACAGNGDMCEDGCPTTGWFVQTGDDDFASRFETLGLDDGDKMLGWRTLPEWSGPIPVSDAA